MRGKRIGRLLSLLMSLVIIISSLLGFGGMETFGAVSGSAGNNVVWSYDSATTTLSLSGSGATYNFWATDIGSNKKAPWEAYKQSITKIIVGEGITELGNYAFYNCVALTSVQLPSTLQKINGFGTMEASYGCFQNCTSLKTITLPYGLESIGNCAFKGCTSLRLIKFPDSLTELSYGAFCDCTSLATVTYGTGLTSTGDNAFYNSGVKKINFSSSITSVDSWSFFNTKIVTIEIPEQVSSIGTRAFSDCTFITDVTVYNRNCEFRGIGAKDPFNGSNQELIIHGHSGSTAETYAYEHNYSFVSLDSCNHLNTHVVEVTPPTCDQPGVSNIVCDDCGDAIRIGSIPATGHAYEEIGSDDQTEQNGHIYKTYKCSVCDDGYTTPEHQKEAEDGITDYVWVNGYFTYTNTSTCTTPGYERYECTVDGCSQKENHIIVNPGHVVSDWAVKDPATCTESGTKIGRCTECGAIVEDDISPLGHTVDAENPITTDDQTYTDGHVYKECRCSVCGEVTLVKEHTAWIAGKYTPNIQVKPTCTIDGREKDTCDICGETREVITKASGEHEFDIVDTTPATCTTRLVQKYECAQCGMSYNMYGDALGHDYIKSKGESLAPTCTVQGYDQYYCSRCSASKREPVPATGHRPDEDTYVTVKAPACETEGYGRGYCTACDTNYEEVIPALGHEYEDISTEAVGKPGHSFVTPKCVRCGSTKATTISHDEWVDGYYTSQVVNEPGCIVSGYTLDTCTICNTTRTISTDALGHVFAYTGNLSSVSGDMIFQCRYCRLPYTESSVQVKGHWNMDVFGTAPIRSEEASDSYLDANGDDYINAKDYAMIINADKEYNQRRENGEFRG